MNRLITYFLLLLTTSLCAKKKNLSVSAPEKDNSVEAELASFKIDERFEVNLFADESMGIANPVCMKWDASGRLWVLCTSVYPQLKPNVAPNDKLFILEDTNDDGKADKVSVFADGLNMPMGFALGHGGVYLAQGRDLVFLKDNNKDGKADSSEILFTGFGTGDTHQNINSLTWSPGGELLFNQGLHCFSRVQTPWGIKKLDEHGSWKLRPLRRELSAYRRTAGGGNPWGIIFGEYGESFIKSNGTSIDELLPSMVQTEHIEGGYWGGSMSIGKTVIKSMMIEIIDTPHFPDDLQGDFIIAGYYARNIARLKQSTDGAGHKLQTLEPLMTSTHNAFRPVDLKTGPDGALYVADWFNPIIGHYQASLRHPDRDKTHGRIWRITAKNKALSKTPDLASMPVNELLGKLTKQTDWVERQALLKLIHSPTDKVIAAVEKWIKNLDQSDSDYEKELMRALNIYEAHEIINAELLNKNLNAKNYRVRAYATRVTGRWHDRLSNPLDILSKTAEDKHPRVRLETIVAASEIHKAETIKVLLKAASQLDRFIAHSLKLSLKALEYKWKPALLSGELKLDSTEQLETLIKYSGSQEVVGLIRDSLNKPNLSSTQKISMLTVLCKVGTPKDFERILKNADNPKVIKALTQAAVRGLKSPPQNSKYLEKLITNQNEQISKEAIRLGGLWKMKALTGTYKQLADDNNQSIPTRVSAINALGELKVNQDYLNSFIHEISPVAIQISAISSLAEQNLNLAINKSAVLIKNLEKEDVNKVLTALFHHKKAADLLANSLGKEKLSPATAKNIRTWLNTSGRTEAKLSKVLDSFISTNKNDSGYSPDYVKRLSKDALQKGDPVNGKRVFEKPLLGCISCHEVKGVKRTFTALEGPNLSAVASGLPVEIIVESVLWPDRQIKEGYDSQVVHTKDGLVYSGFIQSDDRKSVKIKDLVTKKIVEINKANVLKQIKGKSLMPTGLTASLSEQELLDLIKYLTTLK